MVKPFTKVLVGTDFSDSAVRAVEMALDVATRYGATLAVVHAWDVPSLGYGGMMQAPVDFITPIEQAAREQLEALAKQLRAAPNAPEVEALLYQGVAWDRLLAAVDETKADLVVVGTHGRTGIRRALLGSVAERVVRLCPVPVLTVH
jgi:nucleotide-binding universal stress UspA family protein